MLTNFTSFNFWKAVETFGDDMVDLNLPNIESEALLDPNFWLCSSSGDVCVCVPCFALASCFVEELCVSCSALASSFVKEPVDLEESCFPIPKVSLT